MTAVHGGFHLHTGGEERQGRGPWLSTFLFSFVAIFFLLVDRILPCIIEVTHCMVCLWFILLIFFLFHDTYKNWAHQF